MKKIFTVSAVALFTCLVVAACGPKPTPEPTEIPTVEIPTATLEPTNT